MIETLKKNKTKMEFEDFIAKDNNKATHVIQLDEKIVRYSFQINLDVYFNGDSNAKKLEYEKHQKLVSFFKKMETNNVTIYESFNNTHMPVFFRVQVPDASDETVLKIVGQSQSVLKEMFSISKITEICCITTVAQSHVDILFPYTRVELAIVKGDMRNKLKYLLDKVGVIGIEPLVSEAIYNKSIKILGGDYCIYKNIDDFNSKTQIASGVEEQFELESWVEGFEPGKSITEFASFSFIPRSLTEYSKEYLKEKKKVAKAKSRMELFGNLEEKIQTPVDVLEEIKDLINPTRFVTMNEFKSLGQVLANVYRCSENGIKMWEYLARECEYVASCEEEWENFEEDGKTSIRTLQYWASKDYPEEYNTWLKGNIKKRLISCLSAESGYTDIASIIYDIYKTRFICTSIDHETWYEFKNHYWKKLDSALTISKIISSKFAENFTDLLEELDNKHRNASVDDKEITEEYIKRCKKLISNLKTPSFKRNIIREACELFYDEQFEVDINKNEYLIAFENGVVDFTETTKSTVEYNRPVFRPGKPEDKLTISTGYDYIEYDYQNPLVKEVLSHFNKVLTNKNVRNYFWRLASSVLVGKNRDKVLPFFTGPKGNNGKSVTITMFEKALGKYFAKVSYSMLTQMRQNSGAPTPDLVMCQYARMVVCQEADSNIRMASGYVKELTGNDSMQMRKMFNEGENFIPMFKIFCVTNYPPPYDPKEEALLNRIKIVEFNSYFTHKKNCPDSEEEQIKQRTFPIDTKFDEKVKLMYTPFMWLLVQKFEEYQMQGLNEPQEVLSATSNYAKGNNHILVFVDETIQETSDGTSVKLQQLYDNYKLWYGQNYKDKQNMLEKSPFKEFVEKCGFVTNRKGFIENCAFKS